VQVSPRQPPRPSRPLAISAIALCACWPVHAGAQASQPVAEAGAWTFRASLYGYLPTVGGSSTVPADPAGGSINVDAGNMLDNLKGTVMGTLEAHNGRWGAFTDVVYLKLGNTKDQSRDFTIGDIGLPAGTSAHLDWRLKGVVWTLAGQYRLVSRPGLTLDALGGARLLSLQQDLTWDITGNIGPIASSGRAGSSGSKNSVWDGIVGVKGQYGFGRRGQWYAPFYVDVGTGGSDLTWQAAAGIGYAFAWGGITAMWRHLDYDLKPGKTLNDINFDGPMVGVTFRW
jgi:hypothetical protein